MTTLTNKPNQGSSLDFPEDFRAACLIHQLAHEEILQHFIDSVSFCAPFLPTNQEFKTIASAVVNHYVDTLDESVFPDHTTANTELALQFLREIVIITQVAGFRKNDKERACNDVIDRWYRAFDRKIITSDHLQFDEISLKLSRDFILYCEVSQVRPEAILQHFVNHISLPKAWALIASQPEDEGNPAMGFFLKVIAGKTGIYKDQSVLMYSAVQFGYIEKLQELDLRLYFNRNVPEREQLYRDLYSCWYRDLLAEQSRNYTK